KVIHFGEDQWNSLYAQFKPTAGARQIFDMHVDLVQTSCGMAVPFFDYVKPRNELQSWAEQKGAKGLHEYWLARNGVSLDGKPSDIADKVSPPQMLPAEQ